MMTLPLYVNSFENEFIWLGFGTAHYVSDFPKEKDSVEKLREIVEEITRERIVSRKIGFL